MAKNKRKISPAQRDKLAVETAKILKKKGILSKQTKLHGGKYVSRGVLKKVQELQYAAKPSYTAVKVSKDVARKARAEGYQVTQNRVIVPREHDFIRRVRKGEIAGIKPVKGGVMSEVTIPFTADNTDALMDWLQNGNLEDYKLEHEMFAFSFVGNMSYRAFHNAEQMRQYLEHYKQDELIKAIKLFRLHPEDQHKFIIGRTERERLRKGKRAADRNERRSSGQSYYSKRMERLERVAPAKAARIKAERAERSRAYYETHKNDPAYREAARQRALASYHKRKPKK